MDAFTWCGRRDLTACCALLAGCLLGSHPSRLRTIRYSNGHKTFELRSCPHGFESLFILCVQRKNTHLSMSVLPFVSTVRLGCLLGIPAFLNRELNSHLMFLLNKLKDFHFNLSEKPDHINVFDFIVLADIWNFYSFFAIRVVSLFCNDYILMCQSVRTNP